MKKLMSSRFKHLLVQKPVTINFLLPFHTWPFLKSSFNTGNCWKCSESLSEATIFCPKCKIVQPFEGTDYFQLFSLEKSFDVDHSMVTKRYKALQMQLHPDLFANKSEKEQELAADYSALLNRAEGTLTDPLERGLYLLKLSGIEIEEGTKTLELGFLASMMEVNEELEEVNTDKGVAKIKSKIQKFIEDLVIDVSKAFLENKLDQAKQLLMKMKYYVNVSEKIKEKELEMGIVT